MLRFPKALEKVVLKQSLTTVNPVDRDLQSESY
jgi:hypothetical protein